MGGFKPKTKTAEGDRFGKMSGQASRNVSTYPIVILNMNHRPIY